MTPAPTRAWYAIAHTREVSSEPLAVHLLEHPMVLFASAHGVAALRDRCPHRHAPLSDGRVVDGTLACPYHGWRFTGEGRCVHLPGWSGASDTANRRAQAHPVQVQDDLVWVSGSPDTPGTSPPRLGLADRVQRRWRFRADCDALDAIENFLDPLHTHFVHAGLVRREGARQEVPVEVSAGPGWVQAAYTEPAQSGLIRRLFGGGITRTWGRFTTPGLAQLGYEDASGELRLLVSASFVPSGDQVDIVAVVAGRGPAAVPDGLLALVLAPFLKRTVAQDRAMLERVVAHRRRHPEPRIPYVIAPTDLLRPHLERLWADPSRTTPTEPRRLSLWL